MIKCVVPISGGKDSQACLQLACQTFNKEEILGLHNFTGWDHPITMDHIMWMQDHYGVKICMTAKSTVVEEIRKAGRFPIGRARFCSKNLKMRPSKRFYKELAMDQGEGFEVWYGMRVDESVQRAGKYKDMSTDLMLPHEMSKEYPKYLAKLGVRFRLPIIHWTDQAVFDFVDKVNPLYTQGCKRIGCYPCMASSDKAKKEDFARDEVGRRRLIIMQQLEAETGKSMWYKTDDNVGECEWCRI